METSSSIACKICTVELSPEIKSGETVLAHQNLGNVSLNIKNNTFQHNYTGKNDGKLREGRFDIPNHKL